MSEMRSLIEIKLEGREAYSKCLKRAQRLGYVVTNKIPGQVLRIEKKNYTAVWWISVILGFLFYVIPGILVLILWKPVDYCELDFEESDEEGFKTTIIGKIKGEVGQEFFSQVSGILP